MSGSRLPRASKKGGSGGTIALLILVLSAIGFLGYYAFVETGTQTATDKTKPIPVLSPKPGQSAPIRPTP